MAAVSASLVAPAQRVTARRARPTAARGATLSSVVSAGRSSVASVVSEIAPFIRTKNERAVEFSRYSVAYLW